jgi:hypothetical protein
VASGPMPPIIPTTLFCFAIDVLPNDKCGAHLTPIAPVNPLAAQRQTMRKAALAVESTIISP